MDFKYFVYFVCAVLVWAGYTAIRRLAAVASETDKPFFLVLVSFLLYLVVSAIVSATVVVFGFWVLFRPGHSDAGFIFWLAPLGFAVGAVLGTKLWFRHQQAG